MYNRQICKGSSLTYTNAYASNIDASYSSHGTGATIHTHVRYSIIPILSRIEAAFHAYNMFDVSIFNCNTASFWDTHKFWFENEIIVNRSHLNWWIASILSLVPIASSCFNNRPYTFLITFKSTRLACVWWILSIFIQSLPQNIIFEIWYQLPEVVFSSLLLFCFIFIFFLLFRQIMRVFRTLIIISHSKDWT